MTSVQKGQVGIGETLHPHAQPVDRCIFQRSDKLGSHVVGIGFVGHLATSLPIDTLRKRAEQPLTLGRYKCRGSTAAEIDCLDRLTAQLVATQRPLSTHGIDIAPPPRRIGRREEVAIDTATRTKRNVNIDSCHRAAKVVNVAGKTDPSPEFFYRDCPSCSPPSKNMDAAIDRIPAPLALGTTSYWRPVYERHRLATKAVSRFANNVL